MRTAEIAAPLRRGSFFGLSAFFQTELRVQFHEGLAILTSTVVQAVLLVFVAVLDPSLLPIALVGAIIYSMFTIGNRLLNEAAYLRIDHRLNELYLASPLTAEAYFLGMAGGVLVAYLPPTLVLVVLTAIVTHLSPFTVLVLFGCCVAVWAFSASVGYVFSTFFRDNRAIWAYSALFFNLVGVLLPVFYPLEIFPQRLQPLALAVPPSAAAALVQWSMDPTILSFPSVLATALGLAAISVGMLLFAIYWARKTVRAD